MEPVIIIPFYKNEHLVDRLCSSLERNADELAKYRCSIFMVNDSPDHPGLGPMIAKWKRRLNDCGVDVIVENNNINQGFIKSTNKGLQYAGEHFRDAILLNSDTYVFPGLIAQFEAVSKLDPMIGFICPRSNNATILTYPPDGSGANLNPEEAFSLYCRTSKFLPQFNYLPTGIGFCLFIKKNIIKDFGILDEIYGKGYNEENDFIMRAGRCGYRAAVANHAFVWHEGEQSFSQSNTPRQQLDEKNRKILDKRYPEYSKLVEGFLSSPNYRAWSIISKLPTSGTDGMSVLCDMSKMSEFHNGTNEAAKRILLAMCEAWPQNIKISLVIKPHVANAHQLTGHSRLQFIDPDNPNWGTHSVGFRFGQLFDNESAFKLFESSGVILNFMLDTIALDCGQLAVGFNKDLWQMACDVSDVVFTNSNFTANQIKLRFDIAQDCEIRTLLHSTDPREYYTEKNQVARTEEHILIFGNHYPHKFVLEACQVTARAMPTEKIICLGLRKKSHDNVQYIESGALSEEFIEELIQKSKALIYPSHYEGFGLPLMHAIARNKAIILRDIPAYREILNNITPTSKNHHFFEYTDQIPELISAAIKSKDTREIISHRSQTRWTTTADSILSTATEKISTFSHKKIERRLRRIRLEQDRHMTRKSAPGHSILKYDSAIAGTDRRQGAVAKLVQLIKNVNHARLTNRKIKRANKTRI